MGKKKFNQQMAESLSWLNNVILIRVTRLIVSRSYEKFSSFVKYFIYYKNMLGFGQIFFFFEEQVLLTQIFVR